MMRRIAIVSGIFFCIVASHNVAAETLVVTNNADSGIGSLRQAILSANENNEADEIIFISESKTLIVLESRLPDITSDISITGQGWNQTIIDGGYELGVSSGTIAFRIMNTGSLTLDGVMIQNAGRFGGAWSSAISNFGGVFHFLNSRAENNRADYGGWLLNWGDATVVRSGFSGNYADSMDGGAAVNSSGGTLSVKDSVFEGNLAEGRFGGAISVVGHGDLFVEGTLFVDNSAGHYGGAIHIGSSGVIRIVNSTFSGNSSEKGGALYIYRSDDTWLSNVTITGNAASVAGGGIFVLVDWKFGIENSIVSGNIGGNCDGLISTGGYNIEDSDTCMFGSFDFVNTDPRLGTLQPWLDPETSYFPLLGESPAIDAGDPNGCSWDDDGDELTARVFLISDQRGVSRPLDGDGDGIARCDIGAIERAVIFADGFEDGSTSAWNVP